MTRLQQAIEKLKKFPKKEQERFATMVLDEAIWQQTFEQSEDKLDALGKLVFEEIRQGEFTKIIRK